MDETKLKKEETTPEAPGVITTESLKTTDPLKLPDAPKDTTASGIINSSSYIDENYLKTKTQADTSQTDVASALKSLYETEGKQGQYEKDLGVGVQQEKIADLDKQIYGLTRNFKAYNEGIRNNPNITQTVAGRQISEEERRTASVLSDLEFAKGLAEGSVERMQKSAKDKVALETAPLKADLEMKKYVFENNTNRFTTAEKAKLDSAIKADERKLIKEEDRLTKGNEMIINAMQGKAPSSLITKAQETLKNGGTQADVAGVLGDYGMSPADKLDLEIKRLEKSKLSKEVNGMGAGSNKLLSVTEAQAAGVPFGTTEAQLIAMGGKTGFDPKKAQASLDQLGMLKGAANKALGLHKGSGRTGIHEFVGGLFTLTEKEQLKGLSDTLKTNILTMAVDPNIKKFFGPQMTENDVRMMTATGTTLNPDLQTPEDYKEEVARIQDMFNRAELAVKQGIEEENTKNYFDSSGTALQVTNNPFSQAGFKTN